MLHIGHYADVKHNDINQPLMLNETYVYMTNNDNAKNP